MLIHVRSKTFALTDAIRRHAEFRVESMLGIAARRIGFVTVRLADLNAGRGGIDKRCRLTVQMAGHGTLIAEATDEDLYRAIDLACERARREVVQVMKRDLSRARHLPVSPLLRSRRRRREGASGRRDVALAAV